MVLGTNGNNQALTSSIPPPAHYQTKIIERIEKHTQPPQKQKQGAEQHLISYSIIEIMEKDLTITTVQQRPSYISGCIMSPPCFPVPHEFHYSRIQYSCNSPTRKRRWRWRNLLRRFMRESKTLCRPKPMSFLYDPVSYSQNFDDGCHLDEEPRRLSHVFQDFSDAAFHRFDSQCKT